MQRADLPGRPAVPTVQPPADQRTGPRTQSGQHEHHVVGLGGGALPVLGDRGRVGVVLHQDRALEGTAQPLAERQPRPLGQRRAQPYGPVRLHDPRRGDSHGPQGVAGDPGPAQQFGDRGAQPLQTVVGGRRLVDVLGHGAEHPAVQVGEERGDPVGPDVEAQQVSGLGPEPESPRGPSLPPGDAVVRRLLDHQAALDEPLDDPLDGRPGQPRHAGDLGQRRAVRGAQRVQYHRGIDSSQERGIPAGQSPQRPSSQLVRVWGGWYRSLRRPGALPADSLFTPARRTPIRTPRSLPAFGLSLPAWPGRR